MIPPARRIAIRADGGGEIGLGHIMRCSALAQAIQARGVGVDWITATPAIRPAARANAVTVHDIAAAPDETRAIADTLCQTGAPVLVGDWKTTDAARVAAIRQQGWPVVLIGGRLGEVAGDLHVGQSFLQSTVQTDEPAALSGADWLLLGEAYQQAVPRIVRDRVKRVLVSLGGTDTPLLQRVRTALESDPALGNIEIVYRTPGGSRDGGSIPPLHEAIAQADIGILAGGTSLHEAAAMGLPVLCVPIAANQHDRADEVQKAGLGLRIDPEMPCFERRLTETLTALAADPARRARMARRGQALVDGRGADRLAKLIAERFLPGIGESQ